MQDSQSALVVTHAYQLRSACAPCELNGERELVSSSGTGMRDGCCAVTTLTPRLTQRRPPALLTKAVRGHPLPTPQEDPMPGRPQLERPDPKLPTAAVQ